ncbi:hypothetical protein GSI_10069 [Ganoderma sinense ZZ0214-1]|uniref:BTB domain-containing protein n=1 Tax=Ganoderma sinense ZZ0214-1 TaxID=1077348 RepID=A0A2G8RZI0_9APHY|nr:hypothetical protein GSI_10069 [Ganoderma sinense ZZ0214-1]
MLSDAVVTEQDAVLERHPELYFSDGDIVLAAKFSSSNSTASSPPKYQLYRVHKPFLSHNSPVFANLFGDAAPGELYDDVPLVEMIGDTAEALASLLTFIYNISEIKIARWDPNTPIAVSPTVRIADKYLVDGLHKYLVQKVQDDWPLTLEDWDRREAEIEAMRRAKDISGAPSPSQSLSPSTSQPPSLAHAVPEPASAIRFALEFGCPSILPAAFYQLARTHVMKDWDSPHSFVARTDLPARWTLLYSAELMRLLRGQTRMSEDGAASLSTDETFSAILQPGCLPWWENTAFPWFVRREVEESDGREDSEAYPCYALLVRLFAAVFREAAPGVRDPLKALKECVDYERAFPESGTAKRLCTGCDERFKEWIPGARRELWRKLPVYFEVPSSSSQ